MSEDDAKKEIQGKLAQARKLLLEAGGLAEGLQMESLDFCGLVYEPGFGWFKDTELELESEWNSSGCVIGSTMAQHGTMEWSSSSWCH